MTDKNYDVFLSYNSIEREAVLALARRLDHDGIVCFLDKWHLIPGEAWMPELEGGLHASASCAVFIGPSGVSPWQNEEMRVAISRRVHEGKGFRVIPVLLPGGERGDKSQLPDFLKAATWIDFRDSLDDKDEYHRLKCGIRGTEPKTGSDAAAYSGQCPYRGLEYFDVRHWPFFFGRDARIGWLLNELRPQPRHKEENRFLGIIGASGSGKSSLARAGLLAALARGKLEGSQNWVQVVCRPGERPLENLALALDGKPEIRQRLGDVGELVDRLGKEERRLHLTVARALAETAQDHRLVILVDQFEELFNECNDESEKQAFIDNLVYAATIPGGKTIVVVTLRADFYGSCAPYDNLWDSLSKHQEVVPPMTEDELRPAIEQPAHLVGCEVEPGLTELLLRDIRGQTGALPLLEHALEQLWHKSTGSVISVNAYRDFGGLEGALEARANRVYESLSDDQQEICQSVFVRLTRLGDSSDRDTKRCVGCGDLVSAMADPESARDLINVLADQRLVTTGGGDDSSTTTVEIVHEALIRGWSKLRQWLDANRESLRVEQTLDEDARAWQRGGDLYYGASLQRAEQWAQQHPDRLTSHARQFLEASVEPLVQRLASVDIRRFPQSLEEFHPYVDRARGRLTTICNDQPLESREHLFASLALLSLDANQADYLGQRLLDGALEEFDVVREALADHSVRVAERLWSVFEDTLAEAQHRLRAGMALASFDPPVGNAAAAERWYRCAEFLAGQLVESVTHAPVQYATLTRALRPARAVLLKSLTEIFRTDNDPFKRSWATNILADYAADDPDTLTELICNADTKQYAVLLDQLRAHAERGGDRAEAELAREANDDAAEADKEALAKRQANAAATLLHLGRSSAVWPVLRHTPDPRCRSYLLHQLRALRVDPRAFVNRLAEETDVSVRRACILALGELLPNGPPSAGEFSAPLVQQILVSFSEHSDAGVHGAAEWVLRRWNEQQRLAAAIEPLATGTPEGERQWYVCRQQKHELAIISGPVQFTMGSQRHADPDAQSDETLQLRKINRSFALATKPVTMGQYQKFVEDRGRYVVDVTHNEDVRRRAPSDDCPVVAITWYEAAHYCNWLSELEGIPAEQWCYKRSWLSGYGPGMRPKPNYLALQGYRLPSEAEWEYGCRAGSRTRRYYGHSDELLGNYAWCIANSEGQTHPVGGLKPNDLGLFDTLGNVWEWCHDRYARRGEDVHDSGDTSRVSDKQGRVLRGGSFGDDAGDVRSAYRNYHDPDNRDRNDGFRVARTYN